MGEGKESENNLEDNFETHDDYLAFLDLANRQLSDITFGGKRKITCSNMFGGSINLKVLPLPKEGYWYRLDKQIKIRAMNN